MSLVYSRGGLGGFDGILRPHHRYISGKIFGVHRANDCEMLEGAGNVVEGLDKIVSQHQMGEFGGKIFEWLIEIHPERNMREVWRETIDGLIKGWSKC